MWNKDIIVPSLAIVSITVMVISAILSFQITRKACVDKFDNAKDISICLENIR